MLKRLKCINQQQKFKHYKTIVVNINEKLFFSESVKILKRCVGVKEKEMVKSSGCFKNKFYFIEKYNFCVYQFIRILLLKFFIFYK